MPHLTQIAQLPGVLLIERVRNRRATCIVAGALSRPMLLVMAGAAFVPSPNLALALLALAFAARYTLGAIVACGWNPWMRDLVPEDRIGRFFASRLILMTVVGTVLSLAATGFIDGWAHLAPALPDRYAYAALLGCAFIAGTFSVYCMTRIPEPRMKGEQATAGMADLLRKPFRDANFRRLVFFLASWNFAVNLAAPFFTVHMLKALSLDLTVIVGLTVISQLANVLVLRKWGAIADRFSNKSVLAVCGPLFIACIFAWTFTTFPEPHAYTLPLLVAIHLLTGFATAGVTLASGNIGLKLAPRGEATAYLASISLATALAAGLAPIVGGLSADFFVARELSLDVHWASPAREIEFAALNVSGWDFFFLSAAVIGLYSVHRLALVHEVGEVQERVVLQELLLEAKRTVRNLSTVAGLRSATEFPLEMLRRRLRRRTRRHRPPHGGRADKSAEMALSRPAGEG